MKLSFAVPVILMVFLTADPVQARGPEEIQEETVRVTAKGYEPSRLELQPGIAARITFIRETNATCGTEVLLRNYDIERELPLNEPVVVEFTPKESGDFAFTCGMNMLKGKIVVLEH